MKWKYLCLPILKNIHLINTVNNVHCLGVHFSYAMCFQMLATCLLFFLQKQHEKNEKQLKATKNENQLIESTKCIIVGFSYTLYTLQCKA